MRGTSLAQVSSVPLARPLPIVVAIHSFHPGGTERQMTELVRRLDPRRWEVHVACFSTAGPWFSRAAAAAVSVGEFPIKGFARRQTLWQARRFVAWCRARRAAVVHASELYTNIFFLPAAAFAGVRVRVGSRREIAADKTVAQMAVQRGAYAFAHRVIANAEAAAARLRREGVPAHRIAVVPNGLDLTRFTNARNDGPVRHVAMVANLRPEKGHDTLIDAAPRVLERYPDAHFSLIGDGTERTAIEERARIRGVSRAFSFHGHVEDVRAALARADLFTLPSESEAFPNAVLEAMAAGLPVVATCVGGIPEVVEHERTGLLVPPRDPGALAAALCRLMGNPAEAWTLGARAHALVEARFSFERMVDSIEQVYDEELARRVSAARAVRSEPV